MSKNKKINTIEMSAIDIYKLVLTGKLKQFPRNFFDKPDSLKETAEITRYFIEEILQWNNEDIKKKISAKIFHNNKLGGMLAYIFKNSTFNAIDNAYPNIFKPWELNKTPKNFWNKETCIKAIKWLIEEKLKWNDNDIKNKLDTWIFVNNRLGGMLYQHFKNSSFEAINLVYPNKFKEWEFKHTPINFWTKEKGIDATKWLIEEKLKLSIHKVKYIISYKDFIDNGLKGMLTTMFDNSTKKALEETYPNEDFSMIISGLSIKYR